MSPLLSSAAARAVTLAALFLVLCSCGRRESVDAEAAAGTEGEPAATVARADSRGTAPLELAVAASLGALADELAEAWEARTGTPVRVRWAGSSTLSRQIRAGAPADLFLSAQAAWVDGLPALDRRPWLGNRLVLVTAAGEATATDGGAVPSESGAAGDETAPGGTTTPSDSAADRSLATFLLAELDSIVLAQPGVPVGQAAEAVFASLGVPLPARVVRGAHARDVLSKVAQGAAQAGIVYRTDAGLDEGVVVLALLPADSHPPIRYEAALLDPAARALFDALEEPWALELAARSGFRSRD